eukprot:2794163-Rhodomonas_salina.1
MGLAPDPHPPPSRASNALLLMPAHHATPSRPHTGMHAGQGCRTMGCCALSFTNIGFAVSPQIIL